MHGILHELNDFTKPQETKEKKHHLVQSPTQNGSCSKYRKKVSSILFKSTFSERLASQDLQQI